MKKWPVKKWPVVSGQWPVTKALHLDAVAIVRNRRLTTGSEDPKDFDLATDHWPLTTSLL
jgi:hypothetical protein